MTNASIDEYVRTTYYGSLGADPLDSEWQLDIYTAKAGK
jgi:hypothetical protein